MMKRCFQFASGTVAGAGLLLAMLFGGCGVQEAEFTYPRERVTMPEEAVEFFRKHPEFFVYSSPSELPATLKWEDGAGVPELGDPAAKKGGTWFNYIPDFPRTLRFVGPDANGAFRQYILDNNVLSLARQHPNTMEFYPELAKEWAFGDDGRTVYFRLDPAATFSDGVPVRADDYFFCFHFMRSPIHRRSAGTTTGIRRSTRASRNSTT